MPLLEKKVNIHKMEKFITLFVCFFYILPVSFVYAKNTKTDNKLLPGEKKTNVQKLSDKTHLAQRSVSGRKISQAVDSHTIRQTVSEHLEAISKICDENTELSFDQRVENLEAALQELRQTIHPYLREPYLTEEDAIYLRSIEYNTTRETLSFAQPLTGDLVRRMEMNLGETFLLVYSVYYGIDGGHAVNEDEDESLITIEDVKHEWARKIYAGLNCIKVEDL